MYKVCKTENSTKRQRQIELALLELLSTKRYDDISVCDLCLHMQIPRKSFYRYFSGKEGALYGLLDHTMLDYEKFAPDISGHTANTLAYELERFFLFWMSQKPLLDAMVRNDISGMLVERTLFNVIRSDVISRQFSSHPTQFVQKQVGLFCISGLMSIVLSWHHDGYPESPQQMAAIVAEMIRVPLLDKVQEYM